MSLQAATNAQSTAPTAEETAEAAKTLPQMTEAEELSNVLKRILVRSENALKQGDARENIEKLERWIESYRRGLSAAQKISDNGSEMLRKARDQLHLSLEELLRLEDEGGNPPSKDNAEESEELAKAIRRIDSLMPVVQHSFLAACQPEPEEVN